MVSDKKILKKSSVFFILIGIFSIGLYLRTSGTIKNYFAFTFDQGRDFLEWQRVRDEKDISLIGPSSGIPGVFHGAWWYWFIYPIFLLVQGDPQKVVLVFNVLSTYSIPMAFILGRKIHSSQHGLFLAFIICFSPHFISTSAQLWNPNLTPIFILGLFLVFYRCLENQHGFFWVGFILGAIFEFGLGFGALFLGAVLVSCALSQTVPKLKQALFGFCGFIIWLIPRILFDLRHNFLQSRSFITYLTSDNGEKKFFLTRLGERFDLFFGVFKDSFSQGNKILAGIILFLIILWFFKYFKKLQNIQQKFFKFLLLLIFFLLFISSAYSGSLWEYYVIGLPALFLPLFGISIFEIIRSSKLRTFLFCIFFLLFHIETFSNTFVLPEGDSSVYKNQLNVTETIFSDAKGEDFNLLVYSPSVIDYTYHYLGNWYGLQNKKSIPVRERVVSLAYFVIEPEKYNPKLKEAWLRDREGDGVVIWEKTFPGDIQVQRRERKL